MNVCPGDGENYQALKQEPHAKTVQVVGAASPKTLANAIPTVTKKKNARSFAATERASLN
jgi:hypothetical protein